MLLDRPGELVTREEIRQKLWPGDTFVDFHHGLNSSVNRLRDALGDSADTPALLRPCPAVDTGSSGRSMDSPQGKPFRQWNPYRRRRQPNPAHSRLLESQPRMTWSSAEGNSSVAQAMRGERIAAPVTVRKCLRVNINILLLPKTLRPHAIVLCACRPSVPDSSACRDSP